MKIALLAPDPTSSMVEGMLEALALSCSRGENVWQVHHWLCHAWLHVLIIEPGSRAEQSANMVAEARRCLGWGLPILLVAPEMGEQMVVRALDAGADDCLVGVQRPLELAGRLRALHRRRAASTDTTQSMVSVGRYTIDSVFRKATIDGTPISLSPKEFDLAALFLANPDTLIPRQDLEHALWGGGLHPLSRALDGLVCRVRKVMQFGPESGAILTSVHRRGYRLEIAERKLIPLTTARVEQPGGGCIQIDPGLRA